MWPASTAWWQRSSELKTRAVPVWCEALVAGDLDDAALRCEVAVEDDEAAGGFEGLVPGVDHGLAGGFGGGAGLLVNGAAGDGGGVVELAAFEEAMGEDAGSTGLLVVLGGVGSAGGEVADEGRALGDAIEVGHFQGDVELAGDGDEVENGVGGATGSADGGDGVFDGFAGEDLAGCDAFADEVHDEAAGFAGGLVFFWRHGGDAGDVHGGDAEELAGHGHGVGGELSAAGTGAGAGGGFERLRAERR